jgi:hypothetical protein
MPLYADSLSDLKYSQGIVSFKLSPADQPTQVQSIHIPFSDLKSIVLLLSLEMPKIEIVHRNWITEQATLSSDAPLASSQPAQQERDVVGLKIGTV